MNEIKNISSKNYNFDFIIYGKIDDNNLQNVIINTNLKMNEIEKSTDCIFTIEQERNVKLKCTLNVKDNKKIKLFTFNTTKIDLNNEYIILIIDLNKIYLINKNNSKIWLIIGIVFGSVGFIALLIVGIYLYKKKCKNDNEPPIQKKSNKKRNVHDKSSDNFFWLMCLKTLFY